MANASQRLKQGDHWAQSHVARQSNCPTPGGTCRTQWLVASCRFSFFFAAPILCGRTPLVPDGEDKRQPLYAACGAYHLDHSDGSPPEAREQPCRAGVDGILYWVQSTGADWENSRMTRCPPADGRGFRDYEVLRADIGPQLRKADWPAPRGGRHISMQSLMAGIYRTPVSPRDHPAFLADFRAVRARIEQKNAVLRQFTSLTRARAWREIAALHAYLSVVATFVIALTNMERVYVVGESLGFDAETIQALVRLVAGYTVDRARVTKAQAAAEALLLVQLLT